MPHPEQCDAEDRAGDQVERLTQLCLGQVDRLQPGLFRRHTGEVDQAEGRAVVGADDLHRFVVATVHIGGTQDLVSPHQFVEAHAERVGVQLPTQPPLPVHAVDRVVREHLVDHPQAVLRGGQRNRFTIWTPGDAAGAGAALAAEAPFEEHALVSGELADVGRCRGHR